MTALVLLSACGLWGGSPPVAPSGWTLEPVSAPDAIGVSGLAAHPDGTLWLLPERRPVLLSTEGDTLALEGVPPGADTEALAWLDAETIALGIETGAGDERVLIAARQGSSLRVTEQLDVPLEGSSEPNRGIEALCGTADRLVVVSERVVDANGRRFAPYAIRVAGTWETGRIALSTPTGKIAGLACDGDQIWAIERHFGVARILEWSLASAPPIEPTVAVDIAARLSGDLPNFEGIERVAGGWITVTDNDYGGPSGPTWILRLPDER